MGEGRRFLFIHISVCPTIYDPQVFLLKLMLGAIDPSYDMDESGSDQPPPYENVAGGPPRPQAQYQPQYQAQAQPQGGFGGYPNHRAPRGQYGQPYQPYQRSNQAGACSIL